MMDALPRITLTRGAERSAPFRGACGWHSLSFAHNDFVAFYGKAHRIDEVGKSLPLALYVLPTGNLTFTERIERKKWLSSFIEHALPTPGERAFSPGLRRSR